MPQRKPTGDPALDVLPEAYARWRRSTLGRITDTLEENRLLACIGPAAGLEVLDVGCGDGVLATRLAATGATVTGLDASDVMLAAARRRAEAMNVVLRLVAGDAASLPCRNEGFDVVLSVATLCFATDPTGPLGEMYRVLRPGGRLVLGELGRWNTWAALRRMKGWFGSALWRASIFRGTRALRTLTDTAGFHASHVTGAVFYPPCGLAARLLAPVDSWLGRITTCGAAFLILTAIKPLESEVSQGR